MARKNSHHSEEVEELDDTAVDRGGQNSGRAAGRRERANKRGRRSGERVDIESLSRLPKARRRMGRPGRRVGGSPAWTYPPERPDGGDLPGNRGGDGCRMMLRAILKMRILSEKFKAGLGGFR